MKRVSLTVEECVVETKPGKYGSAFGVRVYGVEGLGAVFDMPPHAKLKDAMDALEATHALLRYLRVSPGVEPLPECSACKSERLRHKALDGHWSWICENCGISERVKP